MSASPFPSPKSSMSLRRNAPAPLHVPCSPLLFSPPIPQNNTVRRPANANRVESSWSLASIPIFLDQGDDEGTHQQAEEEEEQLSSSERAHEERPGRYLANDNFASDLPSRPETAQRPTKTHLVPEDVDHADTAYSAAPVPSPRRALRSLGRSINNTPPSVRRDGGPLTPGDEEPASLLLVRRQSAASSADSSSIGSSTGTMVGLGMKRDESEGALSLAGTFGQKGSFNFHPDDNDEDADDRELADQREADRMSMFSLSEYYGRDDNRGPSVSAGDEDEDGNTSGRDEVLDQNGWKFEQTRDNLDSPLDVASLAASSSARTIVPRATSPSPKGPRSPPKMLPRSKSPPPPLTNLRARSPDPNLPDFLRTAPTSPATPSPSPARSDLGVRSVGFPPSSARSSSSASSASHMTPDGKRVGHRVSSSYSSPRNSRASMFVQQGKDISIDLWIDRKSFRTSVIDALV